MNTELITVDSTGENDLAILEGLTDKYTEHAKGFIKFCRENGGNITDDNVRSYFEYLNNSDYAVNTILIKRAAVKSRLRELFGENGEAIKLETFLRKLEKTPETKPPKLNTTEIGMEKIISPEKYEELLQACRSDRQRAFMRFLWETGCRVSEMLNIKRKDIRVNGSVHIRLIGKGSKERTVRIDKELYNFILRTFCTEGEYLFCTSTLHPYSRCYVSRQITKIGETVNLRISAHNFRHSFITHKIHETGKTKAVSVYVGHSSVSTTLNMYDHEELTDADLFGETA